MLLCIRFVLTNVAVLLKNNINVATVLLEYISIFNIFLAYYAGIMPDATIMLKIMLV